MISIFFIPFLSWVFHLPPNPPATCTFTNQGAEVAIRHLQSYGMMTAAVDTIWVDNVVPGLEEAAVDSIYLQDKRFFIAYNPSTPGKAKAFFFYTQSLPNEQLKVGFKSSNCGTRFQGHFIFSCQGGHLDFVACHYYSAID